MRAQARPGLAAALSALLLAHPAAAQSARYNEAPVLAAQVKAGTLPAVANRLPEQPLAVPVVERVGAYGGIWRRAFLGPADANNYVRVVYDALFRFSPDGAKMRAAYRRRCAGLGRFQNLDHHAAQGRALV